MALLINNSSAGINHGSGASLDNLDQQSLLVWARPASLGVNRYLASKFNSKPFFRITDSNGNLRLWCDRSGGTLDYTTDGNVVSANIWQLLAYTLDLTVDTDSAAIYHGDLTAPPASLAFSSQSNSSGSILNNSNNDLIVGNRQSQERAFSGDIGMIQVYDRVLTIGEITNIWLNGSPLSGCVLFTHYGWNGQDSQADWSGNENHGTLIGAPFQPTVSPHMPLALPFGVGASGDGAGIAIGGGGPPTDDLDEQHHYYQNLR